MVLEHAVWVVCWGVMDQSHGVFFFAQPQPVVSEPLTNCSRTAGLMVPSEFLTRKWLLVYSQMP